MPKFIGIVDPKVKILSSFASFFQTYVVPMSFCTPLTVTLRKNLGCPQKKSNVKFAITFQRDDLGFDFIALEPVSNHPEHPRNYLAMSWHPLKTPYYGGECTSKGPFITRTWETTISFYTDTSTGFGAAKGLYFGLQHVLLSWIVSVLCCPCAHNVHLNPLGGSFFPVKCTTVCLWNESVARWNDCGALMMMKERQWWAVVEFADCYWINWNSSLIFSLYHLVLSSALFRST